MSYTYYDFDSKTKSGDINSIFHDWKGPDERIVIYSPHDDDGVLGPGYILTAAQENGAECFVFIFCDGSCGYSDPKQKDSIVQIRKEETLKAYEKLGIDHNHITRFEYPDFSANTRIGWKLTEEKKGSFEKAVRRLREIGVTRLLIPNEYREHLDHEAVSRMGAYHAPQAGDPIAVDWGKLTKIKTVLKYAIWSDFSPEDSLVQKRSPEIRANCGIMVEEGVEERIRKAMREFKSQAQIVDDLVKMRENRKVDGGYIEVYSKLTLRPPLNYKPYTDVVSKLGFG